MYRNPASSFGGPSPIALHRHIVPRDPAKYTMRKQRADASYGAAVFRMIRIFA